MTQRHVGQIENALSAAWGKAVEVFSIEGLRGHNDLYRCHVSGVTDHSTVIAKIVETVAFTTLVDGVSGRFLNEIAALEFLNLDIADDLGVPRLLAADAKHGLMIIEDLGPAPTLLELLQSRTLQNAHDELAALGSFLGRLQKATRRFESSLVRRREARRAEPPRSDSSFDLRKAEVVKSRNIEWPPFGLDSWFYDEIADLESAIHDDVSVRRFLHADAGPQNALRVGESVVLLDYEFASYGHGLLDLVSARLGFPHSAEAAGVPSVAADSLESAYRQALDNEDPLRDAEIFADGLVDACAHWALVRWLGLIEKFYLPALRAPQSVDASGRKALSQSLTVLAGFTHAAKSASRRERLAELIDRVIETMRVTVPDLDVAEPYAALAGNR